MSAAAVPQEKLTAKTNELLFSGHRMGWMNLVMAIVLLLDTEGVIPAWLGAGWWVAGLLWHLYRTRVSSAFLSLPREERERDPSGWERRYLRMAWGSGLWFGLGAAVVISLAPLEQRLFANLTVQGLVSGATASIAISRRAFTAYIIPLFVASFGPIGYHAVTHGTRLDWLVLASGPAFFFVTLKVANVIGQRLSDNLLLTLRQDALLTEVAEARDAAVASARARSEFLAVMSHEIRTPLNGVVGMNGLLLGTQLDAEQREYAVAVQQSAQTLRELIDDILDSSKIDAGKIELEAVAFSPSDELTGLVRLMAYKAMEGGVEVSLELAPGLPDFVKGDWGRIRQVLLNLIGNAIKFTERGSVRCRLGPCPEGLHFEVEDTGVGMTPEEVGRLFRPFTQADASTTRRFGGTGLGLSISQRLVQLMGGTIEVRSVHGQGSTFFFTLALPAASKPPEAPPPEVLPAIPAQRVLVVEDNDVSLRLVQRLLERQGHRVEVARNGLEALARLAEGPFDLVLMDVQMPEMDGLEATRRARLSDGLNARAPIVALTANVGAEDRQACEAAGFTDYLTKPVTPQALTRALSRWARRQPAPRC